MKNPVKIIGIYATRKQGKDTFFNLLNNFSANTFKRFAFADLLKKKVNNINLELFNKDWPQLNDEEKEIMRPIWISLGMAYRQKNPLYWVENAVNGLDFSKEVIYVSCDTRFPNEADFFKQKFGNQFVLIGIKRENSPEPTEEESKWIDEMERRVEYWVHWPTVSPMKSLDSLTPFAHDFHHWLFNKKV